MCVPLWHVYLLQKYSMWISNLQMALISTIALFLLWKLMQSTSSSSKSLLEHDLKIVTSAIQIIATFCRLEENLTDELLTSFGIIVWTYFASWFAGVVLFKLKEDQFSKFPKLLWILNQRISSRSLAVVAEKVPPKFSSLLHYYSLFISDTLAVFTLTNGGFDGVGPQY